MHPEKVLLDKYDVAAMLDVNQRTMGTYLRAGLLPPRVVLSERKKCWLREDIMRWLEGRRERSKCNVDTGESTPSNQRRRKSRTRRQP